MTELQRLKKKLASLISGPYDGAQGDEDIGPLEVSDCLGVQPCLKSTDDTNVRLNSDFEHYFRIEAL